MEVQDETIEEIILLIQTSWYFKIFPKDYLSAKNLESHFQNCFYSKEIQDYY